MRAMMPFCIVLLVAGCASSKPEPPAAESLDLDGDGFVTPEEYSTSELSALLKFEELDTNGDGLLSEEELAFQYRENAAATRGDGSGRSGARRGNRGTQP